MRNFKKVICILLALAAAGTVAASCVTNNTVITLPPVSYPEPSPTVTAKIQTERPDWYVTPPSPFRMMAGEAITASGVHMHPDNSYAPASSTLPRIDIAVPAGYSLDKVNYVQTTVSLSNAGEYDIEAQSAGIRLRGNATTMSNKRPLRVKFDKKVSMFGRDSEKSWVLLANAYDPTRLRNMVAYGLYEYLVPDGTFASLCVPVDLYINGVYAGVYTLCDQIETGSGRLDLEETPGATPEETDYFVEQDFKMRWRENGTAIGTAGVNWFWSDYADADFELKNPDPDDYPSAEYIAYIKSYMDEAYLAIYNKDWARTQEFIDVESFINGFIAAQITEVTDIMYTSVFYYKPAGGKLTWGPLWDCDFALGSSHTYAYTDPNDLKFAEKNYFFDGLMKIPEFKALCVARFLEIYAGAKAYMLDLIDEETALHGAIYEADYKYWLRYDMRLDTQWRGAGFTTPTNYAGHVDYLKKWITVRMDALYAYYSTL